TALSLSFNNLLTKKARTLLTSFAGSIGIIGIALILALSNGVNLYIDSLEQDTLSEYPLQISKSEMDFTAMMADQAELMVNSSEVTAEVHEYKSLNSMLAENKENDLKSLKQYIESGNSDIDKYTNAVEYKYNVTPNIFRMVSDDEFRQINPDKTLSSASGTMPEMTAMMMSMSSSYFNAMPENKDLYENQYEVMAGKWPENYNECVMVLSPDGSVYDLVLYAIGLKDIHELDDILKAYAEKGETNLTTDISTYKYEDFLDIEFKLVDPSQMYEYDKENKLYVNKAGDKKFMLDKIKKGEDLKIVGVVKPSESANAAMLMPGIGYPSSLTMHIIEQAQNSKIVEKQKKNPDINVFTGKKFTDEDTSFNMESMFKFDKDALDLSSLSGSMDMSSAFQNMDMSSMMGDFDLSSAMGDIDLSEAFKDMDMSAVMESIDLAEILKNIDSSTLMEGVDIEAALKSVDLSEVMETLDFSDIDVSISQEDLHQLFDILLASYTAQLPEGELPNFDGFFAYIHSEAGQQIVKDNISSLIDTEALKQKLEAIVNGEVYNAVTQALGEAMAPVVQQVSSNFVKAISEQLAPVFAQTTQQFVEAIAGAMGEQFSTALQQMIGSTMGQFGSQLANTITGELTSAMGSIQDSLADAFSESMDSESLKELMTSMMNPTAGSYDEVLATLNYAEFDDPYMLLIYPKDFESKEQIVAILDDYNAKMDKNGEIEKVITYTDMVGTLMSSVTTIINIVSYVLIAFVAVSLIVSSIMIGIITYISVLERTKEIGILRAVGASKRNISQVFNAETFIIGLCSGIIGIGITLLLLIPGNALIHHLVESTDVNAVLPVANAVSLIILSVVLTLIGGLIPSKKAAKKDPVTALRSE
ncbi:MAG: FtsX-like permease family protein, partial [Ruminococcus sp.]|nr:FtsX-like permease family protein [Ruminococcus sp.]